VTVSVQERVAAPPDVVWALVSDLSRMGEWSPETHGVEWLGGATGPAVGARFRGSNRNGRRAWSTTCEVTTYEPGHAIAWRVSAKGLRVSSWRYTVEPDGEGGTLLTESTDDLRGALMKKLAPLVTGVPDRAERNELTMRETLKRIKAAAESA